MSTQPSPTPKPPQLPKGWYRLKTGETAYWNGHTWRKGTPSPNKGTTWVVQHKVPVIIISIILAITITVGGVFTALKFIHNPAQGIYNGYQYPAALRTGAYDLQNPKLDADWGVTFPLTQQGVKTSAQNGFDSAKVYVDASLTEEYPTKIYESKYDDTAVLQADSTQRAEKMHSNLTDTGTLLYDPDEEATGLAGRHGQRFYGYGGYYYVKFADDTGTRLQKPQVTYFTVKDDITLDPITGLRAGVDENGYPQIRWNEHEEAESYDVYLSYRDRSSNAGTENDRSKIVLLTQVEEPKVDFSRWKDYSDVEYGQSTEQNIYLDDNIVIGKSAEGLAQTHLDDIIDAAWDREKAEEAVKSLTHIADNEHRCEVYVMVRAVTINDDNNDVIRTSALASVNLTKLLGRIPLRVAVATRRINGIEGSYGSISPSDDIDLHGIEWLRRAYVEYVAMADGSVARTIREFDIENATTKQAHLLDDNGKITEQTVDIFKVPCSTPGTALDCSVSFTSEEFATLHDFERALEQVTSENTAMPTGLLSTYVADDIDIDTAAEIKDTTGLVTGMPDEKQLGGIKVVGSNELVKLIAANLIVGNRFIDISDMVSGSDSAEQVLDAFHEAVNQNPITLGALASASTEYHSDRVLLRVEYYGVLGDIELKNVDSYIQVRDNIMSLVRQWQSGAPQDPAQAVDYYVRKLTAMFDYDYDAYHAMKKAKTSLLFDSSTESFEDYEAYQFSDSTAMGLIDINSDGSAAVVCAGYAQSMQLLMVQSGIDSWYVTGTVTDEYGEEGHAWNMINTGEGYRVTDVTWADSPNDIPDGYVQLDVNDSLLANRKYDTDGIPYHTLAEMVSDNLIVR